MIFPRSTGRINERFPRMQIQLRYAVTTAIKVVQVIPDTYIGKVVWLSGGSHFSGYAVMKIIETPSPLIVKQ